MCRHAYGNAIIRNITHHDGVRAKYDVVPHANRTQNARPRANPDIVSDYWHTRAERTTDGHVLPDLYP
jgi:hypothetical protein